MRDVLIELEEEGLIYVDSQGYYREFPYILGLVQGPIHINKHGEGYLLDQEGNKLMIMPKDLGGALNGDIIVAKKTKKMSHGHIVARTDKVIKRATGMVVVEVKEKDGMIFYYADVNENQKLFIVKIAEDVLMEDGTYKTSKYVLPVFAEDSIKLQATMKDFISQGLENMRLTTISETKWIYI